MLTTGPAQAIVTELAVAGVSLSAGLAAATRILTSWMRTTPRQRRVPIVGSH